MSLGKNKNKTKTTFFHDLFEFEVNDVFLRHDEDGSGLLDEEQFYESLNDLAVLNTALQNMAESKEILFGELSENGMVRYSTILDILEVSFFFLQMLCFQLFLPCVAKTLHSANQRKPN
jgi:hypothetical protein